MEIEFDHRKRWFEEYVERLKECVGKSSGKGVTYPCPCCGYPTLPERDGFHICILCDWEDDGQDNDRADEVWGGPNGEYSLSRARENFKRYLRMYDEGLPPNVHAADTETAKTAKQKMMSVFNEMVGEDNNSMLDALWKEIKKQKRILNTERNKRIKAYEAGCNNSEE